MRATEFLTEAKDNYWGYHLVLDCRDTNNRIKNRKDIAEFLETLVKRIKMNAVGKPVIKYLLPDQPNAGYSAMQLIETSSITCHFVEPNHTMYIDIFSCKDFDPADAEKVVKEFFEPRKIKSRFLKRQA